jgi:hypothetical protein
LDLGPIYKGGGAELNKRSKNTAQHPNMDRIVFVIRKIGSGEVSEHRILSTDMSTASSVRIVATELEEEGRLILMTLSLSLGTCLY